MLEYLIQYQHSPTLAQHRLSVRVHDAQASEWISLKLRQLAELPTSEPSSAMLLSSMLYVVRSNPELDIWLLRL
jgi:hypothetical protein